MQENSLVVFVGPLSDTVRMYLKRHNLIIPIEDETTATVLKIEQAPNKCLFSVMLSLDIYPKTMFWNMENWKEVQGPTTVNINEITNASVTPQDVEEYYVMPDEV